MRLQTQMAENSTPLLFVVAEAGSRWPLWLSHYQRVVSDVTVVAGDSARTPSELAIRAIRRLQTLESNRRRVSTAVLLVSPGGNTDEVFESRCLFTRALLHHMSSATHGKLILAGDEDIGAEAKYELMSLADTLTNQLVGTKLSISVRFEGSAKPAIDPATLRDRAVEVA